MGLKDQAKYLTKKYSLPVGAGCPFNHNTSEYACDCSYYDYDECGPNCSCGGWYRRYRNHAEISSIARFVADCIMKKIEHIVTMDEACKKEVLFDILEHYAYDPEVYKKDIPGILEFFKDTEEENKLFALMFGADGA